MSALVFDQVKFMNEVFGFIEANDLSIRAFCRMAGCSAATLYRARKGVTPMDAITVRRIEAAMVAYLDV